jgi:hypothetical protein
LGGKGAGYFKQQSTRPQTLGYGLADSPVGQAAWIYEKMWAWTDNQGNPEDALTLDEMLDNIMLYWLPETATSSARLYWESFAMGVASVRLAIPVGVSIYPRESLLAIGAIPLQRLFNRIEQCSSINRFGKKITRTLLHRVYCRWNVAAPGDEYDWYSASFGLKFRLQFNTRHTLHPVKFAGFICR